MKSLVITLDQMSLNVWGCYGNFDEWTPQVDSWSVKSFVFDQALATDLSKEKGTSVWKLGKLSQEEGGDSDPESGRWVEQLRSRNIKTYFYGEESSPLSGWGIQSFEYSQLFTGEKGESASVSSLSISQLIQHACSELEQLSENQNEDWLMWLALEGVPQPWIVPEEWLDMIGESLVFEEDEENEIEESESKLGINPTVYLKNLFNQYQSKEELLGKDDRELLNQIYSAYACMIDHQIGMVIKKVNEKFDEDIMLVVTSAQGDSFFNEKSITMNGINDRTQTGFSEIAFKIPFVIQLPILDENLAETVSQKYYSGRNRELVQSIDLVPTIFDWFEIPTPDNFSGTSLLPVIRDGESLNRNHLLIRGGEGYFAIRTDGYIFYWNENEMNDQDGIEINTQKLLETAEMYVRPDDFHDINNVISQVPEIAAEYIHLIQSSFESLR